MKNEERECLSFADFVKFWRDPSLVWGDRVVLVIFAIIIAGFCWLWWPFIPFFIGSYWLLVNKKRREKYWRLWVIMFFALFIVFGISFSNEQRQSTQQNINNKVKAAIVDGASFIRIDGICINGEIFVKNDSGDFIRLYDENQIPIECKR